VRANGPVYDANRRFHLDDLHVGQRFVSDAHALDERQMIAFASQFDPQPFHLDDEAAKATLFGGLAASGWHTAAITMRLLVDGGVPIAGGIVGAGGEISWPKPARPGDVLRVESEVVESHRGPAPTAAWSQSAARRATSGTRSSRALAL